MKPFYKLTSFIKHSEWIKQEYRYDITDKPTAIHNFRDLELFYLSHYTCVITTFDKALTKG